MPEDKQIRGVSLKAVLEKSDLQQGLNAKEFSVRAGVGYSTAREWFRRPGFPLCGGVVFWEDFVLWRRNAQNSPPQQQNAKLFEATATRSNALPARAARILAESDSGAHGTTNV